MSYPASTDRWGARVPARGAKQGGGGCDRPHQAFGAAWILGSRRSSPLCGIPYRRAATTTATVWFAQGFVQDEDVALRKAVADYEKASGNQIELSIIPFAPHRQKIISAITSGVVPDMTMSNPNEILQLFAWQDKWLDVSD